VAVAIYVLLLEVVGIRDARQVLSVVRSRAAGPKPA